MIGLIFGETDLPKIILKEIKIKKIKYLIIDLSIKKILKKKKILLKHPLDSLERL